MSKCPFSSLPLWAAAAGGLMALFSARIRKSLATCMLLSSVDCAAATAPLARGLYYNSAGDLWFSEISEFWEGQSFSIKVDTILFEGRSEFQEILIFTSQRYGKVFVLDGAIQVTTLDESSYQEMMTHTPMQLVPTGKVKRVLVIGGGDGGVLRELAKYPEIEEIHICEIDGMVIEKLKEFLPELAKGYQDPRVREHVADGFVYLENAVRNNELFDVIISDLSDPIGPAESIYKDKFLELLSKAVNQEHGVACLQGESYWLHSELIKDLTTQGAANFNMCKYASIAIPTYPCGQIGAIIMTKSASVDPEVRVRDDVPEDLLWYTPDLHAAQFVLPKMVQGRVYN